MAELEKTILNVPNLPNHIQGDGRYLMSLLKSFLEQTAEQVNLANGFSAEDIQAETEGAVQTPRNFFLSFTRLGGEFSWSHINDIASLAYYELRTDKNIGDDTGLLERTVNNSSTKMSVNAVDIVYLYAFNRDGEHSNPAELVYSKPRPDAPTNIAITKSADGSLISFSEIPSNCIGAHIYIEGISYTAYDNIYIFKGNLSSGNIDTIEVAFFDDFGDGEVGTMYLTLPDVTGLLVERNNSELDFYWNPLNIYNIKYVVKVCNELSWEKGTELFRTATNDKNRILYPNSGTYYLMVKAYDENGNYSKNASYQLMTTPVEIDKNIILENNQQDLFFSGNKINLYYDPVLEGVTLEREAFVGEYLFDVSLLQKYRARNWLEADTAVYVTDNNVVWDDALFNWDSAEQPWAGIIGNSDGISVKQQISTYKGLAEDDVFVARFDGNLVAETGETPIVAVEADDFRMSRWLQGLYINQKTKIGYELANINDTFSLTFNLRITEVLSNTVLLVLNTDDNKWLRLIYTQADNTLTLGDSNGVLAKIKCFTSWSINTNKRPTFSNSDYAWYETLSTFGSVHNYGAISDWLTFGITQTEDTRKLFVYSYNEQMALQGEIKTLPIGNIKGLYCYPMPTFADGTYKWQESTSTFGNAFMEINDAIIRASEGVLSDLHIINSPIDFDKFVEMAKTPALFNPFMDFKVGEYEYKNAIVKVRLSTTTQETFPSLVNCTMHVDIPDTDDRGTVEITDVTAPTKVHYNKFYYNPPEVIVVLRGGSTADGIITPNIVSTDLSDNEGRYFEVELLDSYGIRKTGSISWTSKGY